MRKFICVALSLLLTLTVVTVPAFAADDSDDCPLPDPETFAAEVLDELQEKGVIAIDGDGAVTFEYGDEIKSFFGTLKDKIAAELEEHPLPELTDEQKESAKNFFEALLNRLDEIRTKVEAKLSDEEWRQQVKSEFEESCRGIHRAAAVLAAEIARGLEASLETTAE